MLVVVLDIPEFAGRLCSKMVEKTGKEQHWFLLFARFFFVLYKEMEREELVKCSNFLPLHTTPQSVSTIQAIPQNPQRVHLLLCASSLQNIVLRGRALVRFSGTTFHSRVPLAREPQPLVQTGLIRWQKHLASMRMRAGWKTGTLVSQRFQGLGICFIFFIMLNQIVQRKNRIGKRKKIPSKPLPLYFPSNTDMWMLWNSSVIKKENKTNIFVSHVSDKSWNKISLFLLSLLQLFRFVKILKHWARVWLPWWWLKNRIPMQDHSILPSMWETAV